MDWGRAQMYDVEFSLTELSHTLDTHLSHDSAQSQRRHDLVDARLRDTVTDSSHVSTTCVYTECRLVVRMRHRICALIHVE